MDNKSNKSFEDWKQLKQGRIPFVIPPKRGEGVLAIIISRLTFCNREGEGVKNCLLIALITKWMVPILKKQTCSREEEWMLLILFRGVCVVCGV